MGYTKPKKFLGFKIRSKPIYAGDAKPLKPSKPVPEPKLRTQPVPKAAAAPAPSPRQQAMRPAPRKIKYFLRIATNKKGLDDALREINLKSEPYAFVKRMAMFAVLLAVALGIITTYVFTLLNLSFAVSLVLGLVCILAFYNILFNKFISYPIARSNQIGKAIERDILFATRDLVISMRSGMPLFNAMTAVSTGYGAASQEFVKIVSLIQLGSPIEQAIEEVTEKSHSKTFKRIMQQASLSIRVGADVTGSLQSVVDDIMQERVIELRRYGQKLNALAMFYMLFGVIFPSMGVAIAVIMSTFISLFTVDATTLIFVIVGIVGLQAVFLNLIKNSRPIFST